MSWPRLSLLGKILIVANVLLVVAVSAASLLTYRVARDAVRQEIIAAGTQSVQDFAKVNALDFLDEKKGKLDLQLKVQGLVDSDERRIQGAYVVGGDGTILAEKKGPVGAPPPFAALEKLQRASVIDNDARFITIAAPVFYDQIRLGAVVFRYDGARIQRSGEQILSRSAVIVAVALVANFVLLIFVLRRVLRPVTQLGLASEAFAQGDFRQRVEGRLSRDEVGRAAASFNSMADALELHMRFSNAALVERIQHGGTESVQEHQLSVVFGDAAGYTDWAARHSPEEIFQMLSRYYTCMGRITVRSFQGIIDKFMGDGVMMHYGMMRDPRRQSSMERAYVRNALRATIYSQFALKILSHAVEELEEKLPLTYRFGLASGKCMMGPVGAQHIMLDYSIIGNVVNLASRLEAKAPAGGLLIDRFTYIDAGAGFVDVIDGGQQKVKGIATPIQVYCVVGFSERYEVEEMLRFLSEDFIEDELVQGALLPTRNTPANRGLLRDYVRRGIERSPTLPVMHASELSA